MSSQTFTQARRSLASLEILDAYTDFILSRQAMQCTPATMAFYRYTAGVFVDTIRHRGLCSPEEITGRHVREYLAELVGRGKSDATVHDHARAIKTLLRFWHDQGYLSMAIAVAMPRLRKKRLPVLSADELRQVLDVDLSRRDHALILVMADSGLRRAEVCALDWQDVDMQTGLVRVRSGKGGKARSAVIGASTRRALLAYRRTRASPHAEAPVFCNRAGRRLSGNAVRIMLRRLSGRTGIHITAHALRRTFVILSLREGMDVLHLQALLGHASLEMVQHYAQMLDDDLLQAHKAHSPIDSLPQFRA